MESLPERVHISIAGYSWKTNQYGLTIDTAFELVKPDGNVVTVIRSKLVFWSQGSCI